MAVEQRTVYKICREIRIESLGIGAPNRTGYGSMMTYVDYHSRRTFRDDAVSLLYEIGSVTKPHFPSPLFAFGSVQDVAHYVDAYAARGVIDAPKYILFESEAELWTRPWPGDDDQIVGLDWDGVPYQDLIDFWAMTTDPTHDERFRPSLLSIPVGTSLCAWIKPVQVIPFGSILGGKR